MCGSKGLRKASIFRSYSPLIVHYMQLYRQIQAIAALLNHDYTGLKQDLAKQAGKVKVFTL